MIRLVLGPVPFSVPRIETAEGEVGRREDAQALQGDGLGCVQANAIVVMAMTGESVRGRSVAGPVPWLWLVAFCYSGSIGKPNNLRKPSFVLMAEPSPSLLMSGELSSSPSTKAGVPDIPQTNGRSNLT